MAGLVGSGGPPALIAFPCLMIYIKLMKQITNRPVANGLDIDKEKVIQGTIALFTKFFVVCLDNPQEDKLDDRGGHDDADYYLVSDGGDLHPHLHGAFPLDPYDHPPDAEHQLPGVDPHLHGGDCRDDPGTGNY